MSAIASFYVIDPATAADVASSEDPDDAAVILRTRGRSLDDDMFPWSGYCMLELLGYLTERGIPVMPGDYADVAGSVASAAAVLGAVHRPLRGSLDPAGFTAQDLAESMSGFEFDPTEAVMAATDGLNALRTGIDALADDELLVITIG